MTARSQNSADDDSVAADSVEPTFEPKTEVVFASRRGRPTAIVPASLLSVERTVDDGGRLILTFRGRLDLNTVLSFRDFVFTAIGERPSALILDLTALSTVEATGIGTLLTINRVARLVKLPLTLLPTKDLEATLKQTGVDQLMENAPPDGTRIATRLLGNL